MERWEFLRPWCAPLQDRVCLYHDYQPRMPRGEFLGVLVRLPQSRALSEPSWWPSLRDAFLLLAMLAHVDYDAWKRAFVEFCALDTESVVDTIDGDTLKAQFVIECADGMATQDDERTRAAAVAAFVDVLDDQPSEMCLQTARQIASLAPAELMVVEIPVAFEMGEIHLPPQHGPRAHLWETLVAIKTKYRGCRIPAHPCVLDIGATCEFVLSPLDIEVDTDELTVDAVESAKQTLHGDGLGVASLNWNVAATLEHTAQEIDTIGRMLQHFVCSNGRGQALASVEKLGVSYPERATSWHYARGVEADVARFLTAIAEAKSIARLVLWLEMEEMSTENRRYVWERLAYALFAQHSHSSISDVDINRAIISAADADAIDAVVASNDPTSLVFGGYSTGGTLSVRQEPETAAPNLFRINRGTVLTIHPVHSSERINDPMDIVLETDVVGVKIVAESLEDDAVSVLIPGYGVANVRRGDLSMAKIGKHPPPTSAVTHLRLVFPPYLKDSAGLPRFLSLIGAGLTSLWIRLDVKFGGIENDILRCCPNLTTLVFEGVPLGAEAFVAAYRSYNSKISELKCKFDSVEIVLRELGCGASPMRQNICSFSMDGLPQALNAVEEMLAVNRNLQYLKVRVPRQVRDMWFDRLSQFHGAPLPLLGKPMPLESRLAFLGVLEADVRYGDCRDSEISPPARRFSHVDPPLLALIFSFAASRAKRRVYVHWKGF